MKKDVSIIIVNYNGKELLTNCIESIYRYTVNITYEIIVVDNASADGSAEIISNLFPGVLLILSDHNTGFAQGNNRGAEQAKGKYLLFLNSDTILLNNSVKVFFDFMERNSEMKIGAVGGELVNASGTIIHSHANLPSMFATCVVTIGHHLLSLKPLMDIRNFLKKDKHRQPVTQPLSVGYVTGADLFMRKDIFRKFEGFDPVFFMYSEEADLQKRMADQGFQRLIIPGTQIVHLEGATSNKKKTEKNIQYYSSLFTYFKRHNPKPLYLLFRVCFSLLPRVQM